MREKFYKFRRVYVSELGESEDFYEILPRDLTLAKVRYYGSANPNSTNTMFKEVRIKPYEPTPDIIQLTRACRAVNPQTDRQWREKIWNCLKDIVRRNWDDRPHVVAHSGGVDSRILSTIIKELSEERDMGDILFVENGGEGDTFKRIIKKLGFKNYIVYNERSKPGLYHRHGLKPEVMLAKHNGPCSFPYHMFWDSYDDLIKKGVIPENSQFWSAFGPYVELGFKTMSLEQWFEWDYRYQMHTYRLRGDWVFPWWSFDYIYEISKYLEVRSMGRARISDQINPMPEISNVAHNDILKNGYRHVDDSLMTQTWKNYLKTWYGQNIKARPSNHIHYNEWWGQYSESMICERLIKEGHNIKILFK